MIKKICLASLMFSGIFIFSQISETSNFDPSKIPDYTVLKTKLNLKDVVTEADQKPEFPGGMDAFKRKFFEGMPTIQMKQNQKLSTRLYFIVEKDGYIRNVAAVSDDKKHAEAAELGVKRIFTRWKPAMVGDQKVRYLYSFPLSVRKYD